MAMATGLTTTFTPKIECLSTYLFTSWDFVADNGSISLWAGHFSLRSSLSVGDDVFACIPQGRTFLGIPSFSPGLVCPLGWVIQSEEARAEGTNTNYCCPESFSLAENTLSCELILVSDTLWYQEEIDEATTHSELCIPQAFGTEGSGTIIDAAITAKPIIMVWQSSDVLESTTAGTAGPSPPHAQGTTPTPLETAPSTTTTATSTTQDSTSPNSTWMAVGIATSIGSLVIVLIAIYFCYRALKRRASGKTGHIQTEESTAMNSSPSEAREQVRSEMEDPVSALELQKQNGAYQGKPELGSQVDKLQVCSSSTSDQDNGNVHSIARDERLASPQPMEG